jgi:hypothetical protein
MILRWVDFRYPLCVKLRVRRGDTRMGRFGEIGTRWDVPSIRIEKYEHHPSSQ